MKYAPLRRSRPVPDAVVDALDQAGVRHVVGMPGGNTGPLWRALHGHPRVRAVQVREEAIGAAMAEAYGRFTGRPAVVMGQGEWIVGNAGQGHLEALLGSSPVVILTEMSDGAALSHHAPYQSGTGDYGTWDVEQALRGVVKRVMVSHSPGQAVQHTQLALKHALTGQPGPVAVVFHSASLQGDVGPDTVPRLYDTAAYLPPPDRSVDADAVDAAAAALRQARRPVLVAGNGVRLSRAQGQLAALAEALDAPVATTASGKGVFPESSPLAVGPIGTFGWAAANAVVGDADAVVAVGTKLAPTDTLWEHPSLIDPARQVVVQIDAEPLNVGWTFPVDHPLVGDAGHLMDQLARRLGGAPGRSARDRVRAAFAAAGSPTAAGGAARRASTAVAAAGSPTAAGDPSATGAEAAGGASATALEPWDVIGCLEQALGDDAVVTADAGENRLFMMQWFHAKPDGDYLQPAAGGGMGYAVPAAMGVKLADPGRPVVAVCGDGGFAMSIHALMSARQEGLAVAVVVLNNGALGWVLYGMGEQAVAADFAAFDHAAIAASLGCDGVRVSSLDELAAALKAVRDLAVPLVVDVPVTLTTSFRDVEIRPADRPGGGPAA
ncbi:MAG TPA: thiamine pyrophosphate-dependent enzyme [Acidimicrobiales bacterium]|nr:thiamine pyrophosphate-dependent enzyme [Acidimicrobiales bacterium]